MRSVRREAGKTSGDRVTKFRTRAVGEGAQGGMGPLLALALAAVGLEIATLIPYLAGIGMVSAYAPQLPGSALMILFYCAVMITPALVLLLGRVAAHRLLRGPLEKLERFLSKHANGTVALVLFLLGLFLGLNALGGLQEAEFLGL